MCIWDGKKLSQKGQKLSHDFLGWFWQDSALPLQIVRMNLNIGDYPVTVPLDTF